MENGQNKMKKLNKKKQKYWYKQYVGECPVCGRNQGWKEKVIGEKPNDFRKIYIQLSNSECFDHCI